MKPDAGRRGGHDANLRSNAVVRRDAVDAGRRGGHDAGGRQRALAAAATAGAPRATRREEEAPAQQHAGRLCSRTVSAPTASSPM